MAGRESTDGHQLSLPFPVTDQPTRVRDAAAASVLPSRQILKPVKLASIKDWPRSDRPREKLLDRGPGSLTNAELLAVLLRSGPRGGTALDEARALLARADDDWHALAEFGPGQLRDLGLGDPKVAQVLAAFEIAKRYGEREWKPGQALRGSGDVYAHFRERLASEPREHFYAVLLDNKHRKIRDVLLSVGSLTASIVHPRDVYTQVIRHSAAAVIFCHQHPSGDPTPSKEDIEITRRLREVGDLVGVRVLDHIVVGKGRYVSFVDDGYW
jgi:DNA repair protein RadC